MIVRFVRTRVHPLGAACQERTFALLQSAGAQGQRRPPRRPARADHRGGDDPVRRGGVPLHGDGRGHHCDGLSAGAVYRYFPSKEALIRAIVEERVLATAAARRSSASSTRGSTTRWRRSARRSAPSTPSAPGRGRPHPGRRPGVGERRCATPTSSRWRRAHTRRMRFYLAAVARRAQEHGRLAARRRPRRAGQDDALARDGLPHPAADHGRRRPRELHRGAPRAHVTDAGRRHRPTTDCSRRSAARRPP